MRKIAFIISILAVIAGSRGIGHAQYATYRDIKASDVCCAVVLAPVLYPLDCIKRWYYDQIITRTIGRNKLTFRRGSASYFHEDSSKIEMIRLMRDEDLEVGGRKLRFREGYMYFHKNGAVSRGSLLEVTEFKVDDRTVKIIAGEARFYDDGLLQSGSLAEAIEAIIDGKKRVLDKYTTINVNRAGGK